MPGNLLQKFGTNNQSLTITLASLANNAARQSTAVDNSSLLYMDFLVFLKIKTGASGFGSTSVLNVYAIASVDGGTTWSEAAGSTDAAITLTSPPNARLIGQINCVANTTTYNSAIFSVASAFGGMMPERFVIIVENKGGGALDATEGNFAKIYQGVYGSYT